MVNSINACHVPSSCSAGITVLNFTISFEMF